MNHRPIELLEQWKRDSLIIIFDRPKLMIDFHHLDDTVDYIRYVISIYKMMKDSLIDESIVLQKP